MSTINLQQNAVSQLAAQADAIGKLAQDTGAFAAVVAAFESNDPDALGWVLQRLELLPQCELICEWIRIKWCGLRCVEVCGPLDPKAPVPSLPQFARALTQLASNEAQLRRAVDAVSCGDADSYHAAIAEAKLQEYCHLLCRYICSTLYRRICEVVCTRQNVGVSDAALDIRADAEVLRRVITNERLTDAIVKAAEALDCEVLQAGVGTAGFTANCEVICRLVCVWRCVWVSRRFCVEPTPILRGTYAVEEARSFALAARQLAGNPRALSDLAAAVIGDNAQGFSAIVDRYGLGPYCWQVCGWVCSEVCYEFCVCVCPPPGLQPLFTAVGNFDIYTQIDPATGRTNAPYGPGPFPPQQPWGGGPNFAFYGELQLGGNCPSTSPIFPGVQMQYRFLYATAKTSLPGPINVSQTSITVASGAVTPPTPFDAIVCDCATGASGEIITVNTVSGTSWTVTRGATAAAAASGATLFIGPKPITGSLVGSPAQIGNRYISWPGKSGGLATSTPVSTLESVYVGYETDPAPPTAGSSYVTPKHYIPPDTTTGWIPIDTSILGGEILDEAMLNFNTNQVVPGGCALPGGGCIGPINTPGGTPAGTPVPTASQETGSELSIIFQATRVGVSAVDSSNALCTIYVNNWSEINNLWFPEFTVGSAGCCSPINDTLSVQYTADHEQMASGGWSLTISSCSGSAPPNMTPLPLQTTLAAAINTTQSSINVASGAGFPAAPFSVWLGGTGEIMQVTGGPPGTTWTVNRGVSPSIADSASTGTAVALMQAPSVTNRGGAGTIVEDTTHWANCSYTVWLNTRAGLTTGLYDNQGQSLPLTFCICGH